MTRLCYISRRYRDRLTAGNKAKSDYEDIAASLGAVNLGLPRSYGGGKVRTFFENLAGVMRFALKVRRGDTVFLQYPVKKYFTLICRIARMRGAVTVALIHDLGSCRRRKLTVEQEIRRLNHADTVIATNAVMERWLVEHGIASRHDSLGLHDYLSDAEAAPEATGEAMSVAYAGSLGMRKNAFMLELGKEKLGLTLHLYGSLDAYRATGAGKEAEGIIEHGFTPADCFIESAQGRYGLVWDGDSLDECRGPWGEYLRLNTPHKSSFYLRAGLPIIVWEHSAIAPIVRERGIGLTVGSLRDLPRALASITPEQYADMRARVLRTASEIASGANLRAVLARVTG